MAKRTGGFIGQDGINAPDPATGVEASGGDTQATVSFTSPSDVGGADVTEYRVTDSTGAHTASGSASPVTVTGLTNGASYTFNVWAINPFGWSTASDASGSVSPINARALFAGGSTGSNSNAIDYVSIFTTGNATDFGDTTVTTNNTGSGLATSGTRGMRIGGTNVNNKSNIVGYITIASTGNETDFGDLSAARESMAVASNTSRALSMGGDGASSVSTIEYFTIATTGNATSFGDLLAAPYDNAGCSNAHGGLS